MHEIIFSPKAKKQLNKLEKSIQERIITALERIRVRPEIYLTKLVSIPYYKFRVGNYRIIIDLDNGRLEILIIQIGHRKNVYK